VSDNFDKQTILSQLPAFIAGVAICAFVNVCNTPEFLAANAKMLAAKINEGVPQPALSQALSEMGERACVIEGKDQAKYVIVVPRGKQSGIVEAGRALVNNDAQLGLVGKI
jgi:hypothetical protein